MKPEKTMTSQKKSGMKATTLRSFLIFFFILTIIGGAGLYYVTFTHLKEFADEVSHRVADADASAQQIQALQTLKAQIDEDDGLIRKANSLFATPGNYQSQAIRDIRRYATLAGINVTTTTFRDADSSGSGRAVLVVIESPTSYKNTIRFLRGIESNIPKMEVSRLEIGRANTGGDQVIIENVTLLIHVR